MNKWNVGMSVYGKFLWKKEHLTPKGSYFFVCSNIAYLAYSIGHFVGHVVGERWGGYRGTIKGVAHWLAFLILNRGKIRWAITFYESGSFLCINFRDVIVEVSFICALYFFRVL